MNKSLCPSRCWPSGHTAGKRPLLHGTRRGYINRRPCPRVRPRGTGTLHIQAVTAAPGSEEQGDLFIFLARSARHVLVEEGTRSYLTLAIISHSLLNVSSLQQHFRGPGLDRHGDDPSHDQRKFATFIYTTKMFTLKSKNTAAGKFEFLKVVKKISLLSPRALPRTRRASVFGPGLTSAWACKEKNAEETQGSSDGSK